MHKRWVFWTVFGCAAYILLAFFAYRATPLGQVALLDAREQQVLAQTLALGQLPAEPMYRSPLWAGVLSIFYRLGMNDDGVLLAGQVLNILLHALAAWAVAGVAMNIWRSKKIALIAGALYAVYPVALYLAFDLLDTTLAQALLCGGLYFFTRHITRQKDKAWHALLMAVILALAFFARAQLGVVGFGALAVLLWMTPQEKRRATRGIWGGALVYVAILAVFGVVQERRTGVFYILPTQGAYNLWSANRPGATGEYYAQQIELPALADGENPAQAEARALYQRDNLAAAHPTERQVNRYWKGKFFEHAGAHPDQFAALYAKKLYALLHNHEAYNNKTYALQKSESPALRWNPLGFVLLSVLALITLLFVRPLPRVLRPLILLGALYWLAAALFYTSDRFRLALVPLVVVIAAAAPLAVPLWKQKIKTRRPRWLIERLGAVAIWALVFSLPLFGVGATDTTAADRLLMAQAALKTGHDQLAAEISAESPQMSQAQIENLIQARYNLMLKGEMPVTRAGFQKMEALIEKLNDPSPQAQYLAGLCEWQLIGERHAWRRMAAQPTNAQTAHTLAALMMTGPLTAGEVTRLKEIPDTEKLPILLAQASLGHTPSRQRLEQKLGAAQAQKTLGGWRKLFDRAP